MESHCAPRFTHPIFFTTPLLSPFSSLCLTLCQPVSSCPRLSVCISVSHLSSPPLSLCLLAGSGALPSPLIAAIWRLCPRADRCCVPFPAPPTTPQPLPASLPTPPPRTKPSSGSLSLIALPPLCARRSSQQSIPDSLTFIWQALCL